MKKILVTGATGFVGRHVLSLLSGKGYEIIATSRTPDKVLTEYSFRNVQFIEFDLKNSNTSIDLFNYFQRPDLCIHLSWQGLPDYKNDFHEKINLPLHSDFLSNLINNGLKDLTVAGTCLEYGMKEGCLKEDLEPVPVTSYAVAKNKLRQYVENLASESSVSLKWLRLFYLYGKGQNPNSLLQQLESAIERGDPEFNMSAGEQERDFIRVERASEIIVNAALQTQIDGIINCCTGNPQKVRAFVENYLNENHKSIKLNLGHYGYNDYEPFSFWGDTKKLESIPDAI